MVEIKYCPNCNGELERKFRLSRCKKCGIVWEIVYRDDRSF